jgi:hypothetical protein
MAAFQPPLARRRTHDHLAGVAAIALAALCGTGPFLLFLALDWWGPF